MKRSDSGEPGGQFRRDLPDKLTALIVMGLGFSSFAFWWPRFADYSRLGFVCLFPAVFPFCYYLVRADSSFNRSWRRKVFRKMIAFHGALLVGIAFAWKVFPTVASIENPDLVFVFMAIEVAVIGLLTRFTRDKPTANSENAGHYLP